MRTFRLRALLAAAIIALPLIAVPLPAGAASTVTTDLEGTAQISGTVVGPTGTPAVAEVRVYPASGDDAEWPLQTTTTERDGTYSLGTLPARDVIVLFMSATPALLDEYWEDGDTPADARVLSLAEGVHVDLVDARLEAAGSVSGRVAGADGQSAIADAEVLLYRIVDGRRYDPQRTVTAVDGTYRIGNVRPGTYVLRFAPPDFRAGHDEYWGGTGATFLVGRGEHRSNMNGTAWVYAWLSGTVLDANGAGADRTRVTLRYRDGRELVARSYGGDYSFSEVPRGEATLHFSPPAGARVHPQWYGGASSLAGARWFTVGEVANLRTKLVGFLEPRGPSIAGAPIVGGTLRAYAYASDVDATVTYQWYANGIAIKGATKSTYKIPSYRVGRSMSVKATFRKPGHITVSRTSKATDKVQVVTAPTVSGTRQVRATLTAKVGAWATGGKITYRWYADGKQIYGETRKTYRVNPGLRGKRISVAATVSKPGWSVITRASARTSPIRADW